MVYGDPIYNYVLKAENHFGLVERPWSTDYKTSMVMNLSEGSVFSGRMQVQTGVAFGAKLQPMVSKPHFMNSELSRYWAG